MGPGSGWYQTSFSAATPGAGASIAIASAAVGSGCGLGRGMGAIDADASGAEPMSLPPNSTTARPHAPTRAAPRHDMRAHTDGSIGSGELSSSPPTSAIGSSGGGSEAFSLQALEQ